MSRAVITALPADNAQNVPPEGPARVTVAQGRLVSVRLADTRGNEVAGAIAEDGTSWAPSGPLPLATAFTLDAVAEDDQGQKAAQHSDFSTMARAHTFVAFFTPEDGSTVGVGMPVSLRFSRTITDRAAVERAVVVTADPPVEVAAHWFGGQRLDFRPKAYWAAGTRVSVALRLKDVQGAPGEFGTQTKDVRFTIGRAQVSTVDLDAHTLTVRAGQGGKVVRTLKVSGGDAKHTTYRGVLVVSEKYRVTRMNSQTVGMGDEYDIKDVPHAMRLTNSGTFVHGNYWANPGVFGTANTSHGCIGLADVKGGASKESPAGWLFEHTVPGDVLEVKASTGDTVPPSNGLNGWNLPWAQWVAGSALQFSASPSGAAAAPSAGPSPVAGVPTGAAGVTGAPTGPSSAPAAGPSVSPSVSPFASPAASRPASRSAGPSLSGAPVTDP
ncbi:Ig-like domain-containing protein [Streptomyces sp. BE20]|uniref:L,D-transpeptidase n=1 Tax=Streptomyces sp. BE20 TaxID=3002525 RepID=UPI002E766DB8|nr:Ig-like domain-containing protein [Streptomyces sp. BE20]MEE1826773.1 Ig-like domain-containing protein [Streptomyces sp. BE20]